MCHGTLLCRLWAYSDLSHVRTIATSSAGAWVTGCAFLPGVQRLALMSADRTVR